MRPFGDVLRPTAACYSHLLFLLFFLGSVSMLSWDIEPFDMNKSIRSMGDSVYVKNEHVCAGDIQIRVKRDFKLLEKCTVIEGDLIIATLYSCCNNTVFPKLKEVTGKLIVYYITLLQLPMFPNLVVVRGRQPLFGFSFIILDNRLMNLHFPSLRVIQEGGVRIVKNLEMCYVKTILWSEMVGDHVVHLENYKVPKYRDPRSLILLERNRGMCSDLCNESMRCPQRMVEAKKKELCWSSNVCQSLCDKKCVVKELACWMNATDKCCHKECLGGCYGDGSELCVACKNYVHDKQCVQRCPEGLYEYSNRTCITKNKCFEKEGKDSTGYRQNISYSIFERRCVKTCPALHRRNATTGICEKCLVNCWKVCGAASVYNPKTSDKFYGCTSLRKLDISIPNGAKDDMMEHLKRNFGQLEVVEQSVRIIYSGTLNSLSFLSNLRVIGINNRNITDSGDSKPEARRSDAFVFEVVANDGLRDLWVPKSTVEVYGRVRIYLNRKLCANKVFDLIDNHFDLKMGNLSAEERTFMQRVNGDLMPCNVATINLTVIEKTSRTVFVKWSQAYMSERNPFVTLLMIKPSKTDINLSEDRAACQTSSWHIHELNSCPAATEKDSPLNPNFRHCVHSVDKLLPATRYAVYLERKTTQGDHGAVSSVEYFTTLPEPPSPPRDIRITALSSKALKVRWKPPRIPNGKVARYFVWYRPLKLNKKEFARRNFCTYKSPMGHQLRGQHDSLEYERIMSGGASKAVSGKHNNSEDMCDECRRLCNIDKIDKKYQVTEDVNYSFEDSLQNHIFVKRPTVKGKQTFIPRNSSRSIASYEPYVTTASDVRKSSESALELERQNVSKTTRLKSMTPKTPPVDLVRPLSPTMHVPDPKPKDVKKTGKLEWVEMFTVDANSTELIITNLNHYTEYIVAIRACQEPASSKEAADEKGGSKEDMFFRDDSDEYPPMLPNYDSKVCSKKASRGYRTLANDEADAISDEEIEINRENGLRVLWSRPPNPNGMILVYWFHYRRLDDNSKRSNPNSWVQSCVPLQTWYQTFHELQSHRVDTQLPKRPSVATSPPLPASNATFPSTSSSPTAASIASSYASDDQMEIAYLDAPRGGYEFPQDTLSAGEYEFSIMAFSLAGNGSLTKVVRFRIGGEESNPFTTFYIVLSVAAVIVVVVVLLLIAYIRKTRDGPEVLYPNPEYPGLAPSDEWEIPPTDIVYYNKRALGKGHFGVVVKGVVRNLQTPAAEYFQKKDSVLAAIKTVRKGATYQEKMDFLSEANRMKAFHSEHIVKLLGVVSRMESRDTMPQVVLEFMYHGDMASYLKQIAHDEAIYKLSEAKIMLWAAQIADAMAYLGDNRVVHRDLAARNCLVDANEVVKVSDFGLTRELYYQEETYKKKKNRGVVVGPFMWMAPESLARGHFSCQSDVWSYGVVLWEIATVGAHPYPNMTFNGVKSFVLGGSNLLHCHDLWDTSWKRLCPDSVMHLMRRCFAFNDKDRPTFLAILHSLETYMDERFKRKSFYCQQQYSCEPH